MIFNIKVFLTGLLVVFTLNANAQTLKVTLSPDRKKVNRNASDGVSTIIFDSKVKGLKINNGTDDFWTKPRSSFFVYLIDTKKDIERGYELSQRNFILNSPEAAEYLLEIDEILPNQVLYYTVILKESYSKNFSCEYLFSKTAMHGIRIAYGKRVGFYLSYKWGEYRKTGIDISTINQDINVTQAKELGYIRNAIIGGVRTGIFRSNMINLYLLIGGGYGEYGRQWENPIEINNHTYFYSDYIKGFEGEIACQFILMNWGSFSIGTDMVVEKGKISVDYQIGVGINLNLNKLSKNTKKIL